MSIYILIATGRRCVIIWRPGKQTAHYWLTPASWRRIQRITARGHLVRIYQDEQTYAISMKGGR